MKSTTTRPLQIATALAALTTAVGLLVLQIFGGLEYTEGGSPFFRYSMIAAMIVLALLPVFIEIARRTGHGIIGLALFAAFCAFLAYSLPANIGRNGEMKEAKVVKAEDGAQARADLATVTRSLDWYTREMMRECEGAPEPLPPQGWPKCRANRANAKALEERRDRLERQIAQAPAAGDVGSETISWATLGTVSEKDVRRGSVMAFAVGLDIAIWALTWLATALLTSLPARMAASVPAPAATYSDAPETTKTVSDPPRLRLVASNDGTVSKQEALRDLLALRACGFTPPSQDWLTERWNLGSKGTTSKWCSDWEAKGLIDRTMVGRRKEVA